MLGGFYGRDDRRVTHFHGVDEHPRQAERDALRELHPVHSNLEAVPEVDVKDLVIVLVLVYHTT